MREALFLQVHGIVQGVGFRPFVYRLAQKYLISGWVLNAVDGVFIHAEGETKLLDGFVLEISENPPVASRVEEIKIEEVPLQEFETFEIRFSDDREVSQTTLVSPDLATCDDCVHELFDPTDRRYRYPFINCTNCGPRFTIIEKLPYDRASTSMKDFSLCEKCAHEYGDPLDRRFHAQPDACFACGPHVSWREHEDADVDSPLGPVTWGETREESDAIFERAADLLSEGKIVAVKGLGGFHLVCDAGNPEAVARLRTRKRREGKAFAVMLGDADAARRICHVGPGELSALEAPQRPIVLLRKRSGIALTPGLADGLPELGVMLPSTPVQHVLLHDFAAAVAARQPQRADDADLRDFPSDGLGADDGMVPLLVMTSGNLHDEPIVIDDADAYGRLSVVADAFLGHDRAIRARYDDSVVRVIQAGTAGEAVQFIRRARGYAPLPLALPESAVGDKGDGTACTCTSLLAVGPEQKNTFTLTRGSEAFVSQHVGDMENAETYDAWLDAKARYEELFKVEPALIACDLHPEYLTSKWAHAQDLPVRDVQHHHAHVVSVMGEHGLSGPVCGIAFDGTGYGIDGAIWGGEVLLSNLTAFERFANFAYVPMPGGAAAVNHPLRMAYGVLWAFDLLDHPAAADSLSALGDQAAVCGQMIDRALNTPLTSSVGRLFDAASALLGICVEPRYEGEAAILLEAAMQGVADGDCKTGMGEEADDAARFAIEIVKNTATAESTAQDTSVVVLDAAPAFAALLDDKLAGVPLGVIARRFHAAFVRAIVQVAELVRGVYGISTVALSGGVFMNRYLVEHALASLESSGFTVAVNRDLPPNDGCLSFGQAVIAWASSEEGAVADGV